MDMVQLQKEANHVRYALVVIDIVSKKGEAESIKNKDRESVYNGSLVCFQNDGVSDECVFR
jgi:hypothetical protein